MLKKLLPAGFFVLIAASDLWSDPVALRLDATDAGRVFEGIGAVSAGASSRLLIDYPEPQRSEILDYLFKPKYGAGFQHLKVEVGGDVNSTDGCEPSHMHTRDDENDQRGYEWWLMEEAKKRNPQIILDCLAWGAPAWIGNGKYYSQDMADYLVKFIRGAKKAHGLDIEYVGIWNERHYDAAWIKLLRKTLDQAGLTQVKIAAADDVNNWGIVDDMIKDPDLKAAISVVAIHYPHFKSTPEAHACGLPLWVSEDGPWNGGWGAARRLAQMYNRNYAVGKMTTTEIWSPVSSYYDNLPLPSSGVMRANTPWSGSYEVQPATWGTAHTTQFIQPGWKYLDSSCTLIDGGSVVALKSPDGRDYSVIIETTEAKSSQTLSFRLANNLPSATLHVWRSDDKAQFVQIDPIQPENGMFQITLEPGAIYSLTTTTGQQKGGAVPPATKPFPLPYTEDFESYDIGATPRYASDYAGIFAVTNRADGKGKSLRQIIAQKGIEWQKNAFPETFLGSLDWTDYEVSIDALIEQGGFVSLFGRVGKIRQDDSPPFGYWLKVDQSGKWELSDEQAKTDDKNKKNTTALRVIAASGNVPFAPNVWHHLTLRFFGSRITVLIDGKSAAEIEDKTFSSGMVGFGGGWNGSQFDNLAIREASMQHN